MSARIFSVQIEANLGEAAARALDAQGLGMVSAEFDHLDAVLSGNVSSREKKLAAAAAIGELDGVRVVENRITYGEDPPARLIFEAGDPVRVSGEAGVGWSEQGLAEGFDWSAVETTPRAELPWAAQLGAFTKTFFENVEGGRLEFDGRRIVMGGEVPNLSHRWQLIDHAEGLGGYVDLSDQLVVAPSKPFAISIEVEGGACSFAGLARDDLSLVALGASRLGAEIGNVSFDARVAAPAWLWRVAVPIRFCSRAAITAEFELSPGRLTAVASFPGQFWLEAAERELRAALPNEVDIQMDFQVGPTCGGGGRGRYARVPARASTGPVGGSWSHAHRGGDAPPGGAPRDHREAEGCTSGLGVPQCPDGRSGSKPAQSRPAGIAGYSRICRVGHIWRREFGLARRPLAFSGAQPRACIRPDEFDDCRISWMFCRSTDRSRSPAGRWLHRGRGRFGAWRAPNLF